MFIRTERLFLRPRWPDDLDDFVALLDEEPEDDYLALPARDRSEAAQLVISQPRDRFLPTFFINLRTDSGSKLIGGVGLTRSDGDADAELHFWIARTYRSHGFCSEAVRALLQHSWMLGHMQIVALHFASSDADHRVLTSAGFMPTGESCVRFSERDGFKSPAQVYVAHRPAVPAFGPIMSVSAGEARAA